MGYYDPSSWIDSADQLITDIEDTLRANKVASQTYARRRKHVRLHDITPSFLPPNSFELEVLVRDSGATLFIREWVDKEGKISIDLIHESEHYRKGHFKHIRWHHNPNCRNIPPNHIHFPTLMYNNLMRQPTYAYPSDADNFIDALRRFCNDTNINIDGITIPLLWG